MRKRKINKPKIDWNKFDSGLEWEIYKALRDWRLWEVTWIEELSNAKLTSVEVKPYIVINKFQAGIYKFRDIIYTPDFIVEIDWKEVILEVKSKWSWSKPDYRLRVKLFLSQYNKVVNFAELINIKKWVYEFKKYYT